MQKLVSVLAILALGLMLGMAAVAQTSTSSPQTSNPTTQAAPQGQSGSQGGAPQNRAGGQQGSVDDELQLTPDQKQKIAAVVDDENKQMGAVRDDTSLNMDQKQQKALQIRQAGSTKIKAVLTPEQLQKLAAIQERNRQQQNATPAPQ